MTLAFWVVAFCMFIWTLRNLPFINLEAAMNLQFALRRLLEKLRKGQDR